ncbi:SEC10/PgrA surface exclusion domain-containing protein [Lacticaseibacillus thailandensis]|nr:SEC10/PgrA surface exclusion domain-containing protein [Lacticaseibacillus thailandensis]
MKLSVKQAAVVGTAAVALVGTGWINQMHRVSADTAQTNQITVTQAQLEQAQANVNSATAAVTQAQVALQQAQAKVSSLTTQLADQQAEVAKLKATQDDQPAALEAAQAQLAQTQGALAAAKQTLTAAQNNQTSKQNTLAQAQTLLSQDQSAVAAAQKEVNNRQTALAADEKAQTNTTPVNATTLANAKQKLRQTQQQANQADQTAANKATIKKLADQSVASAQQEDVAAKAKLSKDQANLDAAQAKLNQVDQKIADANTTVSTAEKTLAAEEQKAEAQSSANVIVLPAGVDRTLFNRGLTNDQIEAILAPGFDLNAEFHHNEADEKVTTNLDSPEIERELSIFAASLLNPLCKQLNFNQWQVTDLSVKVAQDMADQYDQDKFDMGATGDHDLPAFAKVESENNILGISESGLPYSNIGGEPFTSLDAEKESLYYSLLSCIFNDEASQFGHTHNVLNWNTLLDGPSDQVTMYEGISHDHVGETSLHFVNFGLTNNDSRITASYPIPTVDTGLAEQITSQRQVVAQAKQAQIDASNARSTALAAQADASFAVQQDNVAVAKADSSLQQFVQMQTAAAEDLASAQKQQAAAQAAMQQAQTALDQLQAPAATDQSAVTQAQAALQTATAALATAKAKLSADQAAVDAAQRATDQAQTAVAAAIKVVQVATAAQSAAQQALVDVDNVGEALPDAEAKQTALANSLEDAKIALASTTVEAQAAQNKLDQAQTRLALMRVVDTTAQKVSPLVVKPGKSKQAPASNEQVQGNATTGANATATEREVHVTQVQHVGSAGVPIRTINKAGTIPVGSTKTIAKSTTVTHHQQQFPQTGDTASATLAMVGLALMSLLGIGMTKRRRV